MPKTASVQPGQALIISEWQGRSGRSRWYITLRCEGLKSYRYGPFGTRSDARTYYRELIELIDNCLQTETPYFGVVLKSTPSCPRLRRQNDVCVMDQRSLPPDVKRDIDRVNKALDQQDAAALQMAREERGRMRLIRRKRRMNQGRV